MLSLLFIIILLILKYKLILKEELNLNRIFQDRGPRFQCQKIMASTVKKKISHKITTKKTTKTQRFNKNVVDFCIF